MVRYPIRTMQIRRLSNQCLYAPTKQPELPLKQQHSVFGRRSRSPLVDRYARRVKCSEQKTGDIKRVPVPGIPNPVVSCILVTRNDEIWLGLDEGLFKYSPKQNEFIYLNRNSTNGVLSDSPVKSLPGRLLRRYLDRYMEQGFIPLRFQKTSLCGLPANERTQFCSCDL